MDRTFNEALAGLDGIALEQARAQAAEEARLTKRGKKYRKRLPGDWPPLTFNWDLTPDAQRYVYDGMSADKFSSAHPRRFRRGQSECRRI